MITDETGKRLCKIEGKMMSSNGKHRSADDVINELIDFWEEKKGK